MIGAIAMPSGVMRCAIGRCRFVARPLRALQMELRVVASSAVPQCLAPDEKSRGFWALARMTIGPQRRRQVLLGTRASQITGVARGPTGAGSRLGRISPYAKTTCRRCQSVNRQARGWQVGCNRIRVGVSRRLGNCGRIEPKRMPTTTLQSSEPAPSVPFLPIASAV